MSDDERATSRRDDLPRPTSPAPRHPPSRPPTRPRGSADTPRPTYDTPTRPPRPSTVVSPSSPRPSADHALAVHPQQPAIRTSSSRADCASSSSHRLTRTTRSVPSAPLTARRRPAARRTPRASSSRRSVLRPSSPTRPSASVSAFSSSRTARRVRPRSPSCRRRARVGPALAPRLRDALKLTLLLSPCAVTAFVPNDGCLNFVDENDEVLVRRPRRLALAVAAPRADLSPLPPSPDLRLRSQGQG